MKKTLVFTVAFAPLLLIHSWADDRMNMVFLLTDDQTTYSMGCYGNEDVQTPHVDSLARDGLSPRPMSSPCRAGHIQVAPAGVQKLTSMRSSSRAIVMKVLSFTFGVASSLSA